MTWNKKRIAVAATAFAVVIAGAGTAFAYWTAGGSGTGTAATATDLSVLTVNQTTTVAAMYPGDSAQTLSGTFDNTNSGPAYVGTVTASISSVFQGGVVATGCTAADYTLDNATMTVNAEIPTGSAKGAWTGATIKFNDTAANQDACKGATVNLAYTIS